MFIRNEKRFNIYAPQEIDGATYPRFTDPSLRDQLGITEIPEPEAPVDYSDETYFRTEQDDAPYVVYTRKSDEQIAEAMLAKAKGARQAEVDAITVTVGEKVFDGDERSQDRMSRAINAMDDADQTLWVLADNTPSMVTKAELRSALRLAGEAQTAIWIKPYQ